MARGDSHLNEEDFAARLALARAGSERAVGDLLAPFQEYLRLVAHAELDRKEPSRNDASDVVQETLLEAHRDFQQFAGSSSIEFKNWLLRMLRNNLLDEHRHRRRRQRLARFVQMDSGLLDGDAFPGSDPTPSGNMRASEQSERLRKLIQSLSPDHCQVLLLRHFSNLSFPEIGATMGRTADATRKLWLRALTELERQMRESSR